MEPRDFGHDAVIDAINNVNKYAKESKKVVLISTVLPGTTRKKFVPLLDAKHQFCYNPYLIAMGSVKWDMANPEMVIIGTEDGSLTGVAGELIELYKQSCRMILATKLAPGTNAKLSRSSTTHSSLPKLA
jgi:UDPglucose 6-dehydrogenase